MHETACAVILPPHRTAVQAAGKLPEKPSTQGVASSQRPIATQPHSSQVLPVFWTAAARMEAADPAAMKLQLAETAKPPLDSTEFSYQGIATSKQPRATNTQFCQCVRTIGVPFPETRRQSAPEMVCSTGTGDH